MNREKPLGGHNVFAEVGLPAEYLAKADIVIQIEDIIKRQHMTQKETAAKLGIDQPRVSALLRGRLDLFSLERLMGFAQRLGNSINITLRPSASPSLKVRMERDCELTAFINAHNAVSQIVPLTHDESTTWYTSTVPEGRNDTFNTALAFPAWLAAQESEQYFAPNERSPTNARYC